jgi:hypothetical protein
VCAILEFVVAELVLQPERTVRAATFAGDLVEVPTFRVDIELAGERLRHIEALATRRPYIIVGRNALQHFVVRLDGPRATLEVRRPRAGRR